MRTLIVDNYDSFTYNLVHLVAAVTGQEAVVVTNDTAYDDLPVDNVDTVIISPGPGHPGRPGDFGVSADILARTELPILGVCLGHQGLCAHFGGHVGRAPEPMHGRPSAITHNGKGLFAGIPNPFRAVRYHSLAATELGEDLEVTATSDDGVVMAVRHRSRPLWGVQFHPESIRTDHGRQLIDNFCRLAAAARHDQHNAIHSRRPVRLHTRRITEMADPAVIHARLYRGKDHCYWLDSAASGDPRSRWSILGDATGPLAEVVTYDVATSELTVTAGGQTSISRRSIFDHLRQRLADMAPETPESAEFRIDGPGFELGYVGYLGYEMKAETGGVLVHRATQPDAALIFSDRAIICDRADNTGWLLALSDDRAANGQASPVRAEDWLDSTAQTIAAILATASGPAGDATHGNRANLVRTPLRERSVVAMRHDKAAYKDRIAKSLEWIRAGETYELCLTNTARATFEIDPVVAYTRMRQISPVPFGALLRLGDLSVLSASPERFLAVGADGAVESRPVKGTRPRGGDPVTDAAIAAGLADNEKDRAENLMIVDLVRNDLGRVCVMGSISVPELFAVETFPNVHQLVSTVTGQLRPGLSALDAVIAAFPGGSMTGAPKVRTMELIDQLEDGPRGVYSGSLGWFSLTGACDLSIVIRTITLAGSSASFGTGGAIVALSDPEAEWEETRVKSQVMVATLGADDPQSVPPYNTAPVPPAADGDTVWAVA